MQQRAYDNGGVGSLASGILGDAQDLFRQEVALAKAEMKEEVAHAKRAAVAFGAGTAFLTLGGVLILFTLVHLLDWLMGPRVPLWGSYGIVALLTCALGGAFFLKGKKQFDEFDLVPRQTLETLKETFNGKHHTT